MDEYGNNDWCPYYRFCGKWHLCLLQGDIMDDNGIPEKYCRDKDRSKRTCERREDLEEWYLKRQREK